MMLTLLGFGMTITFMVLIMTKRLSPMVALISIPILFAFAAGFGSEELSLLMLEGVKTLAPTGVMLMFAILYFGLMIDVGLFEPAVRLVLRLVGNDPLKVVVGTAVLAAIVSLDGDGSTAYMITVAAMLPVYRKLQMDPLNLACVTMLAGGVMNLTPWGGPLARAASALHVDPSEVFVPLLPAMLVGTCGVIALSWFLGKRERLRLGHRGASGTLVDNDAFLPVNGSSPANARLRWVNLLLTAAIMLALICGFLPPAVLFMLGFAVGLMINFPKLSDQQARVAAHAKNVVAVVSIIFAAGIFTGILNGTGMVDGMSRSFLAIIPPSMGPYLASITAVASMPFTFFVSNDAFYFGVLPILSEAAGQFGITPAEMARASLSGQPVHLLSPLVPSTYLLVSLSGVELGQHQRYTLKWAVGVCLLIAAVSALCGAFPMKAQ